MTLRISRHDSKETVEIALVAGFRVVAGKLLSSTLRPAVQNEKSSCGYNDETTGQVGNSCNHDN